MLRQLLFIILLINSIHLFSQNNKGHIKGSVKTADGKSAQFVNVGIKGTAIGAISNGKGEYEIKNLEEGEYVILVSLTGLETKEQIIQVKANETTIVPEIHLNENAQQLNEVVVSSYKSNNEKTVTIGKIDIKPMDLPQSVVTIDKEILQQQQTLRVSDALKNINGVYQMGATGGYQEEIAGRGFSFGSSNTFKNGIRFNNAAMPEMSALERLEVMKGSAAILFGNVTAGGVLNLVTKKPVFEHGGEISMRLGSYDFYKPSIDVYGSLNTKKTAAYRVNTTYEKSRSFRNIVQAERFYINPSLLFKLGKKINWLLEGDYLSDNRTADFGVGAINYSLINVPRNRFLGVEWSNIKTEQKSITSTITYFLNDSWQIRNVTSYQNFNNNLFANQRPNGNNQFIQKNGDWIRGLQKTQINEDYYLTQLDLTGKFSTGFMKHNLLFGADADKYFTDNLAYNAVNRYDTINVFDMSKYKVRYDIPNMTPKTLTSSPINRVGVYIQDLISFTSKIKFLAGVRFSYLETFSNVYTYSSDTYLKTENYSAAYTPRFGLVYQPIKTMSIFASYANSFNPNTGIDISGKALAPSYVNQYEAGIKNDFCKGLISANVTAYQIINSNVAQISLENGNTNTNIKELAGEITSQGIELDLMSKEWKGLSFIGGYSYNETKYTKTNTYIVGSKLLYNPNHTANASVNYTFRTINCLKGLNLGASAIYIGERSAGRLTRVQVANDTYKPIPLNAFTQFDASIGYSRNNLSLKVKLSNITNELNYYVHDDNSINPIAPRQFSATLGFKF